MATLRIYQAEVAGQPGSKLRVAEVMVLVGTDARPPTRLRAYGITVEARPAVLPATSDQTVESRTVVTLSATMVGTVTAWSWTQTAGPAVVLVTPGNLTNLVVNPTPGVATNWSPNVGAQWQHTYNATDKCIDVAYTAAGVAAQPNMPASWYNLGLNPSNPVLIGGVKYQRSVEIWVRLAATLKKVATGSFEGGQALPAGQWTRVVEQFTAAGAAQYVFSASIEMLGLNASSRTNLQSDPRFTSLTAKTAFAGTSPNSLNSILTGVSDHPAGITTAYRGTVGADHASTQDWYVGAVSTVPAPVVGDYYRAGVWVRRSVAGQMYLRQVNVNGSATPNGPPVTVPADTWTWLTVGGQVASGTTSISYISMPGAALALTAGWTLDMSGLVVQKVANAAAAAVPLTPAEYFDGSTPDDPATFTDYAWTGSSDASTSTRVVGAGTHVKIRRSQLIENPGGSELPYFDGATPDTGEFDHAWTGATNNSTSTATFIGPSRTFTAPATEDGALLAFAVRATVDGYQSPPSTANVAVRPHQWWTFRSGAWQPCAPIVVL